MNRLNSSQKESSDISIIYNSGLSSTLKKTKQISSNETIELIKTSLLKKNVIKNIDSKLWGIIGAVSYTHLFKLNSEKQCFGLGRLLFPTFKVVLLEQFINITLTVDDFTFYLDKGCLLYTSRCV